MKIKGSGKIPDYIQVRDDGFTLIAYFKADSLAAGLRKANLSDYIDECEIAMQVVQFGEMKYIKNRE
jgi:hypothetical protein